MKYFNKLGALLLFLGTLSCQAQDKGYESLTVEAFCQTIADTTVVRLDVRTAAEFAEGHIERAVNIDVLSHTAYLDVAIVLVQDTLYG
ncbi:rhodanese-like domain-containing protein [Prevotella sp.]|uniref:rhodanese-like domain-containing protein n=1 Tax=Prevotella sp. TaxID=59823 RepID=UPI0030789A05